MALICLNEHWFFCFLKGPSYKSLETVNFMNEERAKTMKDGSFKNAKWSAYEDCSDELKKDLNQKLFLEAEAYRPLLQKDSCHLVLGFTSDTLQAVPNEAEKLDAIVAVIAECMKGEQSGAYLRFQN